LHGAATGHSGFSGAGGLLRDCSGTLICGYTCKIAYKPTRRRFGWERPELVRAFVPWSLHLPKREGEISWQSPKKKDRSIFSSCTQTKGPG
jgi:hypothetical protein